MPASEASLVFNRARQTWHERPPRRRYVQRTVLGAALALAVVASIMVAGAVRSWVSPAGTSVRWSVGARLLTGREQHTATLLQNGMVLVSGGADRTAIPLATAELYNPKTNHWSPAGTMATARVGHTATLLRDGRVLVVGGLSSYHDAATLPTAELYDPKTNTWSSAPPMRVGRALHTATLLLNGRVLVAGGLSWNPWFGGVVPAQSLDAEIYDPSSNRWSSAAPMSNELSEHTATLLRDGRVLVAGGHRSEPTASHPASESGLAVYPALRSTAIYDPSTNRWLNAAFMTRGRYAQTATLLPNGDVLLVGGVDGGLPVPTAELYDPAADRWSPAANMAAPRIGHTATLLRNGTVLVVGNAQAGTSHAEVYDPASDRWSVVSGPMQRDLHTATKLSDGTVLITGGFGSGSIDSVVLYGSASIPVTSGGPTSSPALGRLLLALLLFAAAAGLLSASVRQHRRHRRGPAPAEWIVD